MQNTGILVYHSSIAESYADLVRYHGYNPVFTASTEDEAIEKLPFCEIVFGWKFPTHLLSTPPARQVRWFQSMGAGVDDLMADISIPEFITVTRVKDLFGPPIAEYVFAYLLYLQKDIERIRSAQKERNWQPFVSECLLGKRIGVAGLGSIGAEIIRKARAFDMETYGLSFSGQHAGLVDRHFTRAEWIDFVKDLDILVLTLPLTPETYQIVNKDILQVMKSDAILVNVGRGKLIEQSHLVEILRSGHLQAAVLDVFEEEPLPVDNPLWNLPNVLVTPHLSGPSTPEGVGQFFIQNLKRYFLGKTLEGVVSRNQGY